MTHKCYYNLEHQLTLVPKILNIKAEKLQQEIKARRAGVIK
jgi:hypothetical protein